MSFSQSLLVVCATVEASAEADWNRWYNEEHLPEIVACPGFQSGHRYVSEEQHGERRYIALYELDDPSALQSAEFAARRGWGPYVDKVRFQTALFSRVARIAR